MGWTSQFSNDIAFSLSMDRNAASPIWGVSYASELLHHSHSTQTIGKQTWQDCFGYQVRNWEIWPDQNKRSLFFSGVSFLAGHSVNHSQNDSWPFSHSSTQEMSDSRKQMLYNSSSQLPSDSSIQLLSNSTKELLPDRSTLLFSDSSTQSALDE